MSFNAKTNIVDIEKFKNKLSEATQVMEEYGSNNGFENVEEQIQKEKNELEKSRENNEKLKEKIDKKKEQLDEKIEKTQEKIDKLEEEISKLQEDIQRLLSDPKTAALAAALQIKLEALQRKLDLEKAELQRLENLKPILEQHKERAEKRDEEITNAIEQFDNVLSQLDEIKSSMLDKTSELSSKCGNSDSVLDNAINKIQEYLGVDLEKFVGDLEGPIEKTHFDKKDEIMKAGISIEEMEKVQKDTGFSTQIVMAIRSEQEGYKYQEYNLSEGLVGGKPCLKQPVIDFNKLVSYKYAGEIRWTTNLERMRKGQAPIGEDGKPFELHHIGQNPDAPLAELTTAQHRSGKSYGIFHTSIKEPSKIDRIEFAIMIKKPYWRARAREYMLEIERRNAVNE